MTPKSTHHMWLKRAGLGGEALMTFAASPSQRRGAPGMPPPPPYLPFGTLVPSPGRWNSAVCHRKPPDGSSVAVGVRGASRRGQKRAPCGAASPAARRPAARPGLGSVPGEVAHSGKSSSWRSGSIRESEAYLRAVPSRKPCIYLRSQRRRKALILLDVRRYGLEPSSMGQAEKGGGEL